MNKIIVLLKKEIISFKEEKNIAVLSVFCIFAISSPIILNLLPEIIKSSVSYGSDITTILPKPNLSNVINTYSSGITQLGILVICFVFGGAIVEEKNQGLTALVMMKSVSRQSYFISKIISTVLLIILITIISSLLLAYTTWIFIPDFDVICFLKSMGFILMFNLYVSILSVALSSIFNSTVLVGGITFISILLMRLSSIVLPRIIINYLPSMLIQYSIDITTKYLSLNKILPSIVGSLVILIVISTMSLKYFKKTEL